MKKTRDIHHFWLFPKQPRIYQLFIDFFLRGNRGKWIKTIKKWWKLIKKWKNSRHSSFLVFSSPAREVCEAEGRSARQGMSARGVLGEVCARGDVWGGMGGLPGEVCQGKLGRLAGEVCQVCTNMINWQLINQINKLYLYSFYGILWSDVQLVIKPNTFS